MIIYNNYNNALSNIPHAILRAVYIIIIYNNNHNNNNNVIRMVSTHFKRITMQQGHYFIDIKNIIYLFMSYRIFTKQFQEY
jgi:hypothetical protein